VSPRRVLSLAGFCVLVAEVLLPATIRNLAVPLALTPQASSQTEAPSVSDAAYQRGMQFLRDKRYADALEQFLQLEREAPHSPQGPAGEGMALALMGEPQKAIQALQKALSIDPSFWVAQRQLGIIYWQEGRKEEASQQLGPVAKLHPDDGPANLILGQCEFERRNYSAALTYLARIPGQVSADPQLALIQAESQIKTGQTASAVEALEGLAGREGLTPTQDFKLAWLFGRAHRYKSAIEVFDRLPSDYPDSVGRAYGLALAYFGDAQYERCVSTLNALAASGKAPPEVFGLLGVAEETGGHTKEAYDAFRQGVLAQPDDPQNYLNIATLACEHLNYDLAVQILNSGIERIPSSHELVLSRGIAYTLEAQFSLARQDYERAIQMAPDDASNYTALGLAQLEAGELDSAASSFEKASQCAPTEARPYYFLTEALMQKGVIPGTSGFASARQAIEKSIELDPGFSYAYVDRAKLELKSQQVNEAIADLERARSVDPNSGSALFLLAQAYQRKGDKSKADELFAKVRQASARDDQEFRKNALTQALVVISNGER